MKNKLNKIIILVIMAFIMFSSECLALDLNLDLGLNLNFDMKEIVFDTNSDLFKVYGVKEKEEVMIENDKVVDFYEETHEEITKLIDEEERKKILEQKRVNKKVELVKYAKRFTGNRYVRGGNSLTKGTDCSGFVKLVYAKYGVKLPRTSKEQARVGHGVSRKNIEVGDIISYGYNGKVFHSAIYIGNGKIVHASTEASGIRIDKMTIMPIVTIRRVI